MPSREKQLEIIAKMDADKLYVENVRHFLGIPQSNAEFLCEQAVKSGIMVKRSGLLCPQDQNIIFEIDDEKENIPETVTCEICEDLGRERSSYLKSELDSIVFYQAKRKEE